MRLRLPALVLAALLAACAAPRPAPVADREMTVLVYNIHAGKDAAGDDNLARVAEVVRATGADLVLLQEVDRGTARSGGVDQPAELARLTGYAHAFGRTLDFGGGEYGVALLSRWPVERHALVPLPVEPPAHRPGEEREPRGVLRARVAAPGGAVTVLDTHLDHGADDHWRLTQLRTLLRVAEEARAEGAPLLLGGDFNAAPDNAVHAALAAAGFRDAWTECGRGDGHTFPASAPDRRIDYLYLHGATRCVEARVVPTDASDHLPLLVRLRPGG